MKKISILITICVFLLNLIAQSFYIKPFYGYGYAIQGEIKDASSSYYFESNDTSYVNYDYKSVSINYGKGKRYGLGLGAEFSKNFVFELVLNYSKGKTPDIKSVSNNTYDFDSHNTLNIHETYNSESKSFQISPELIFKTNTFYNNKITPYLKLGTVIAYTTITESIDLMINTTMPEYYPIYNVSQILENERISSIGLTTTLGCEYLISDNIYLFTEGRYRNLNCKPEKAELTKYEVFGNDELASLTDNEKYIEFVQEFSTTDNNDPNKPDKSIFRKFDLTSFSVIMGFKINVY